MIDKLSKDELVNLVNIVTRPKGTGLSSEEINRKLLTFCANCPDPAFAMFLMVECMDPMSSEELVEKALAAERRSVRSIPSMELPLTHPLRTMCDD